MTTIALWTNILAFTFLSSSTALSVVVRLRKRHLWFNWYIVYAACYALWALIFAIHFFLLTYETNPAPAYSSITAVIRVLLSCGIISGLPLMIRGFDWNERRRNGLQLSGIVSASVFLILGILAQFIVNVVFITLINIFFNGLLIVFSIYGLVISRRTPVISAKILSPPFFYVSICFYTVAAIAGLALLVTGFSSPVISSFAVSAYCIPWALATMTKQAIFLVGKPQDASIPAAFIADYGLTPRESDIAFDVANGRSNLEIADQRCISLKTVETHLYNVYRKLSIRNRVELVNRIDTYRSGHDPA